MASDRVKFAFLLPAVLYVLFLVIFPLAMAAYNSLTNAKFGNPEIRIVGIDNYMTIVSDYRFNNSVIVTLVITAIAIPIELGLGIFMALLINRPIKGRGVIRTLFLIPLFISPIAFALMGQVVFYEGGGGINGILKDLGLSPIRWRSDPIVAKFTVALADIWMWTPFVFLIFLAGLEALPRSLLDAARVDGASEAQIFKNISLPLLSPVVLTILFFRLVDTLRIFEIPFTLLGGGGPGIATETLTVYIYKIGFRGFFFGQAAAASFLYLLLVSIIIMVLVARVRKYYV